MMLAPEAVPQMSICTWIQPGPHVFITISAQFAQVLYLASRGSGLDCFGMHQSSAGYKGQQASAEGQSDNARH